MRKLLVVTAMFSLSFTACKPRSYNSDTNTQSVEQSGAFGVAEVCDNKQGSFYCNYNSVMRDKFYKISKEHVEAKVRGKVTDMRDVQDPDAARYEDCWNYLIDVLAVGKKYDLDHLREIIRKSHRKCNVDTLQTVFNLVVNTCTGEKDEITKEEFHTCQ